MNSTHRLLDSRICDQARRSRDARFDGLFFTAVTSTGIYCRPVCPAPTPKRENIRYYAEAAAAEVDGFRPCLRCRPELSPASGHWRRTDDIVARALRAIADGVLNEGGVESVAKRVNIGSRQLRRLFDTELGATPIAVATTQRLLFAKQLLSESQLPVIDVALASGFHSLRRFNAAFKNAYRITPSSLRRHGEAAAAESLRLQLSYRPPYNFKHMLNFLRQRALPGIETITAESYRREIPSVTDSAWFAVEQHPTAHALSLRLHNISATELSSLVARIRRMFDLDADPLCIQEAFSQDEMLSACWRKYPGQRLAGSFDNFETAVRAVLGQQISVSAARTMAKRVVANFGQALSTPGAMLPMRQFPSPEQLSDAPLESIGLIKARAHTLRSMARALIEGKVSLRPEQRLDDFVAAWTELPGIGDWTAQYIALRALSHPDAFPANDLILRRAAAVAGKIPTERQLRAQSEAWRPWRGYAVMQLWQKASDTHER